VLVECDSSIKAIILKIDSDSGYSFVAEDLDDKTLVVREPKLAELKSRLDSILAKTMVLPNAMSDSEDE